MTDLAIKACLVAGTAFIALGMLKFLLGKGEETQPAELEPYCHYAVVWTGEAKPRPFEIYTTLHEALEALMLRRGEASFPARWRVIDVDAEGEGFLDPLPPMATNPLGSL